MHIARLAGIAGLLVALFPLSVSAQNNLGQPLDGLARLRNYRSMRASSTDPDWRNGNGDARPVLPGQVLTLASLKGPGEIDHFWNTIADGDRGYPRLLVLRMYWDGETNPSVECPIGDFFAMGHGLDVPFDSLPVRVTSDGRGRNCYWQMPFRKSARVTITNEGRHPATVYWYVDWRKLPRIGKDIAYFHAQYHQEFPTVMGRNYPIVDIEGRGHYVGTVLSCRQLTPSWWGEGNDYFFIDGEKEPSLRGTGTEDYFCDGWGFRKQAGPFYGAPLVEGYETGNRTTVYRWHIPDPVVFTESLHVEIEHRGVTFNADGSFRSGFEERADDFSSVAFWYQIEPHKPFAALPPASARLYYDYSKLIAGDALIPAATATSGSVQRQEIGSASGGGRLFWTPTTEGQTLTVPLDVAEAGKYEPLMLLTTSWDYGIYDICLDGKSLGAPVDLFTSDVLSIEKSYAPVQLTAGRHVLTFVNHGKSPGSKGYFLGFEGILLAKR